jgi:hypothetical protein
MRTATRLAIGTILAAALLAAAVVVGPAFGKGSKPPKSGKALACSGTVTSGSYSKVSVAVGATCSLSGVSITGDLKASGAAALTLCKTSVGGDLKVAGTTGAVSIGSAAACGAGGGNTITGGAGLHGNSGTLDFSSNSVGTDLKVAGNTGTTTVANNTVTGDASCSKGTTASGNTVGGKNKGC